MLTHDKRGNPIYTWSWQTGTGTPSNFTFIPTVTKPSRSERMRKTFVRLANRVRQVFLRILPVAHPTHPNKKREKIMAAAADAPTKTLSQMRKEAEEQGITPLTRFDDPAMIELVTRMHKYAADKDWCAEFDRMAQGIGIPARPKKDYFTITKTGVFDFNGQQFDVVAVVDVFGEMGEDGVGIESSAIEEYEGRYGKKFDDVVKEKWQQQALSQMVSTFTFAAKEAADAPKEARA